MLFLGCEMRDLFASNKLHSSFINCLTSSRSIVQKCSVKKILLEIPENSQENTCDRVSFLIKLQAATLLKEKLWHRCLPVNFLKFLRTPFLTEHLWWLLQVILMQLRKATGNALELNTLMLSKT